MSMNPRRLTAVLSIAALFSLAACSGSDSTASDDVDGVSVITADSADTAAESTDTAAPQDTSAADASAADGGDAASSAGPTVNIKDSRYDPTEIEAAVGDTITFTNQDAFAHTVTSKDDAPVAFNSGNFKDGATFDLTIEEAGTYNYFCEIHPTMRATIVAS